ncbi:putative cell wall-binding protein [Catenulispora sp. GP43]|uniref:cell wall-binding repeat-containing protein n=1 Tax=Catenulispora sp. GP43 TaxID=3156263 RepID=UPI003515A9FF
MKSVKHKGLALVAVSSSMVGLGVGMAGTASALAWSSTNAGPNAALKAQATVSGSGASAVLTVNSDATGSKGDSNITDFGDGTTASTLQATHAYAPGALKETLTETSHSDVSATTTTKQVAVDATDPANIKYTSSVLIDLNAAGAVVTSHGTSSFDLSKILPAGTDLSGLAGTCDHGRGALPLTIDTKAMLATCNWTGAAATGQHVVTLTYSDNATGLKSTADEAIGIAAPPVAAFTTTVLSPGLVSVNTRGSSVENGIGTIDWGDGSTSQQTMPIGIGQLEEHTYTTTGLKTITFSVVDKYGQQASTTQQVDVSKANANFGQLTQFAGATRYGTGVAVSQEAFPFAHSAGAVVLARGDVYADALAGIPLAKAKNGPLLLTPGGASAKSLDANVAAEIKRVLPADKKHTVYILGGVEAIPQSIQDYISNTLGYNVERFGGATRYDTALGVAQNPQALNNPKHIVVARGDDFADALSSGPLASDKFTDASGAPAAIVLSTGNGVTEPVSLTPATAAYVTAKEAAAHPAGQTDVAAIGGGAVKAVAAISPNAANYTPIAGVDRFDTAAKVASFGWGTKPAALGVANGMNFPDSLTGGALMALQGSPLLLSVPGATSVSEATSAAMTADKDSVKNTYLFGGDQVFPYAVATDIMKLEGLNPAWYREAQLPF